jgi:hypothetical protein
VTSAAGRLLAAVSNAMMANPMCPSAAAASGVTEVTEGRVRTALSSFATWLLTAGFARGAEESNTTWALSPDSAGKRLVRKSCACCDWPLPPKLSWKRPPVTVAIAMSTRTPRIQPASTWRRWS